MKAGDVLGGRYRLVSPIGEGGMGAVWRAHQIELDAAVAIKMLHTRTAQQPGALSRFRREAKAAAGLRSPHVVQIVDYGVDEPTGTAFIAMELLEGESLAQRLARAGKLPPEETARWLAHVARALARAHASGVVHRDLKPANVFIVENADEELAKVLDFGIAKVVGPGDVATATGTGALLGTPHYMSPEQIDPARSVDFRTDLWSLGVIACECLTGRRPFEGDTLASLAMKISLGRSELPSSLGAVPRGFDAWFARCTDLDPARRFASAVDLAAALREVVESGEPMLTEPTHVAQPVTLQQERLLSVAGVASHSVAADAPPSGRRARLFVGALVAIGVALAGVMFSRAASDTPRESNTSAANQGSPAAGQSTPSAPVESHAVARPSDVLPGTGAGPARQDAGAPLNAKIPWRAATPSRATATSLAGQRSRARSPEREPSAGKREGLRGTKAALPTGDSRRPAPAAVTPSPPRASDPYDLF